MGVLGDLGDVLGGLDVGLGEVLGGLGRVLGESWKPSKQLKRVKLHPRASGPNGVTFFIKKGSQMTPQRGPQINKKSKK